MENSWRNDFAHNLYDETRDEHQLLGARLHVANQGLWEDYDRKAAEAAFRISIILPITLLLAALAWRDDLAFLAGLIIPLWLAWKSVRRAQEADDVLIQAVIIGLIKSPTLERLRQALATVRADIGEWTLS